MKYDRFESLPVWQASIDLAVRIDAFADAALTAARGDLRSQLLRATLSISNNIAEGFERGTTQELITFLYIARGSAGEVRSMLRLMLRLPQFSEFSDLKSEISDLISRSESVSRQLRAWADSLQNSEIKGQRYLTDAARTEHDRRRRSQDFWDYLMQVRAAANPERESI